MYVFFSLFDKEPEPSLLLLQYRTLLQCDTVNTTDHEVAGSIPGTSTNFKCGLGLERGPPSLVRTIG